MRDLVAVHGWVPTLRSVRGIDEQGVDDDLAVLEAHAYIDGHAVVDEVDVGTGSVEVLEVEIAGIDLREQVRRLAGTQLLVSERRLELLDQQSPSTRAVARLAELDQLAGKAQVDVLTGLVSAEGRSTVAAPGPP